MISGYKNYSKLQKMIGTISRNFLSISLFFFFFLYEKVFIYNFSKDIRTISTKPFKCFPFFFFLYRSMNFHNRFVIGFLNIINQPLYWAVIQPLLRDDVSFLSSKYFYPPRQHYFQRTMARNSIRLSALSFLRFFLPR